MPEKMMVRCDGCNGLFRMPAEKFHEGRKCPKCRKGTLHPDQEAGAPVPPSLLAGLRGKYNVVKELGRGGMGIVYKADQLGLNRTVALKVLIAGEGASPELITRFVREAQAAGSLHHPNIVQVHDAGVVAGMNYFAMDFVQGTPLDELMRAKKLDVRHSVGLVVKIADALEFAHEKQIIHRDLKPGNVIVDERGEPKVMDFGLAKDFSHASDLSVSGALIGTPAYMSPEAARGEIRQVDRRSDVYSLGVILYEMVTGVQPFKSDTLLETIAKVVTEEPAAPRKFDANLPVDLDTICLKAITKDPADRYQSMAALAADLEAFLRGDPISARPLSAAEHLKRKVKRHRVPVVAAAGVLLIILGLSVTLMRKKTYIDKVDKQLAGKDTQRRLDAVKMLATELKSDDGQQEEGNIVDRLMGQLKPEAKSSVEVRLAAVKGLREAKAREGVTTMRKLMREDPDARVRKEAIDYLVAVEDTGCKDELIKAATEDASDSVRLAAIRALGRLGDPTVHPTLIRLHYDSKENNVLRMAAKESLGMYGTEQSVAQRYKTGMFAVKGIEKHRERFARGFNAIGGKLAGAMSAPPPKRSKEAPKSLDLSELKRALASKNLDARLEAVFALEIIAKPETVALLLEAVKDPDRVVSSSATQALINIPAQPGPEWLGVLMESPRAHTRANAVRLVTETGCKELADKVLLQLGKEKDVDVIRACLDAVVKYKPQGARAVVQNMAEKAADKRVREAATQAQPQLP